MSITPHFTPVPRQSSRHDGWTQDKQTQFIAALADYGIVRCAAEKVGMGAASAYRLRQCEGAESFAAAWDAALKIGMAQLSDIAMDRAIHGVAIPHFYKGEQVGERRWFDNRLLMFMLRQTQTRRYGRNAADFDFADEVLAAERAREERTAATLARAETLLEALEEMIDATDLAEIKDDEAAMREFDQLCDRRDRLTDLIESLQPAVPTDRQANGEPFAPAYLRSQRYKRR
jgi:hypothetical protein